MIGKLECNNAPLCIEHGIDCGRECAQHPCYGKDCTMCEEWDVCPIKKTEVGK